MEHKSDKKPDIDHAIDRMLIIADSVKHEPYIIEMKQRIESGNIAENIMKEIDRLREFRTEYPKDRQIREFSWLYVNYILGKPERLEETLEKGVRTLPYGKKLSNVIDSYERVIHHKLKEGIIDIEKFKLQVSKLKEIKPNDDMTRLYERALNSYAPPKPLHFKGNLTDKQLNKLYTGLTTGGYLPTDNTGNDYKAFNYVFGGKGKPEDFKVLEWIPTKSLLAYFIDLFCYTFKKKGQRTDWKFAEIAFNVENLRGAKNDYQKIGQLPIGHEEIENLIRHL